MSSAALGAIARDLKRVPSETARKAARTVSRVADAEAKRATGDGRLSGMGRRPPRLRTVQSTRTRGKSATVKVVGVPAGAWAILQSGAVPHVIRPRRPRGVLVGASMRHPVSGPVRHPGSRAKGTWDRVVEEANRLLVETFTQDVSKAVR